jgi:hypothetical protein
MLRRGLLALAALMATACASGGAGSAATMRETLGRVLGGTLEEAREVIWQRYNIIPERTEYDATQIFVQSIWLLREAEPSEVELGAVQARNRVTIQGRSIERTMDGTDQVYRVNFEVSNQIQNQEGSWVPAPMPAATREFFERVHNDMRLEVNTGVRR